ncbi:unnamed protein product [Lampetra planeri]
MAVTTTTTTTTTSTMSMMSVTMLKRWGSSTERRTLSPPRTRAPRHESLRRVLRPGASLAQLTGGGHAADGRGHAEADGAERRATNSAVEDFETRRDPLHASHTAARYGCRTERAAAWHAWVHSASTRLDRSSRESGSADRHAATSTARRAAPRRGTARQTRQTEEGCPGDARRHREREEGGARECPRTPNGGRGWQGHSTTPPFTGTKSPATSHVRVAGRWHRLVGAGQTAAAVPLAGAARQRHGRDRKFKSRPRSRPRPCPVTRAGRGFMGCDASTSFHATASFWRELLVGAGASCVRLPRDDSCAFDSP